MKAGLVSLALGSMVLVSGCASPGGYQEPTHALKQGAAGAGLGAIAGAVAGNNIKGINRGEGAIAGAALGALIGAAMGAQQDNMDQQMGAMNARVNAANEAATTTIINVKNSNGSYTPVVIRKLGNQYVGPRGEYYGAMPTEEQLKGPYGF